MAIHQVHDVFMQVTWKYWNDCGWMYVSNWQTGRHIISTRNLLNGSLLGLNHINNFITTQVLIEIFFKVNHMKVVAVGTLIYL